MALVRVPRLPEPASKGAWLGNQARFVALRKALRSSAEC